MSKDTQIVALAGFLTFIFGFGAGALLNLYLLAINSPLVTQFRSTLTFHSAVYGDGILLPIVNMLAVNFLLRKKKLISRRLIYLGLTGGVLITAYFHITQALQRIVNWAMPAPWHWNILGVWHAFYMLAVASLLSLFYLVFWQQFRRFRRLDNTFYLVTFGIILFFVLLRLDYLNVNVF